MQKKKENIIVLSIITIISIVLCINFIKWHTVPDTYDILARKQEESLTFFKAGRIITGAFIFIGYSLNIPIKVLGVCSNILAVLCQIISVYIIYKVISENEEKVLSKAVLLMGAYLTVFNPLAIEHLAYVECGIICLAKLFCVISAKKLIIDNKKIEPIILIAFTGIMYQGILNVFITISVLFMCMQKDKSKKEKIEQLLYIILICLTVLIFVIIVIKLSNIIMEVEEERIGKFNINENYIFEIIKLTTVSLITTWNLSSKYFLPSVLIITALILAIMNKKEYLKKWIFILLIAIASCVFPVLLQEYKVIGARMITSISSMVGISVIILKKSIKDDNRQNRKNIIIIFSAIVFGVNSFFYINNGIMLNKSNKLENEYLTKIVNTVNEYERKENIKIKKVALYSSNSFHPTFLNYPNNSFTIRGNYTAYSWLESLEYCLDRKLEKTDRKSEYKNYFQNKKWDDFSEEQLIFEGDTLHFCYY